VPPLRGFDQFDPETQGSRPGLKAVSPFGLGVFGFIESVVDQGFEGRARLQPRRMLFIPVILSERESSAAR
jgi:hypothetical protein